jgi:hypothetical protein
VKTNQIAWDKTNAAGITLIPVQTPVRNKMDHNQTGILGRYHAGKKGQSGPPGNANAFRHGLATIERRRADGALTEEEQDIRTDILAGLVADKAETADRHAAERILA